MDNTIIFGNGINRLSNKNISWDHLLDTIKGPRKFNDSDLPNTMIYERIILEKPTTKEDVIQEEFEIKKEISGLLSTIEPSKFYVDLYNLNFQNYLTTNYDYGYLYSIESLEEVNLPTYHITTEDVYSIRRLKKISNKKEKTKNFWQIHGEIQKPATIMLGLDHYCGSIGKIDSYIKGWYRYNKDGEITAEPSIEKKFNEGLFNNSSWVELFFTTNIHIIGFTLDYSEIDLWWIINKRARMKKSASIGKFIQNKITFYLDKNDIQKIGLLNSMDIEVVINELQKTPDKYVDYYNTLLKQLKKIK